MRRSYVKDFYSLKVQLRYRLIPFYLFACFAVTYLYSTANINQTSHVRYIQYNDYCVIPNAIPNAQNEEERIAQILHMSSNILDQRLVDQVVNWNGPVSLSIVLIHQDHYHCVMQRLKDFVYHHDILKKYLRVHLMFPRRWSDTCMPQFLMSDCNITKPSVDELANYPANIARNVARMFSSAKYILIADFEHLFSKGFEQDVLKIAQKTLSEPESKRVLVYRIFEIEKEVKEPETKKDLEALAKEKKAIVFHSAFYDAHNIPKLEQWFAENRTSSGMSWENIPYNRFNWEPQFVSRADIPMHDLNFPFLLRDNTVLRWELCRAGYQLDILSDHFMYHKGIKKAADTGISGKVQQKNRWKFSKALDAFNKRMDAQYPDTKSKCPVFQAKKRR